MSKKNVIPAEWANRLKEINPHGYSQNCAECSVLTDKMLEGQEVGAARDVGLTDLAQLERFFGSQFEHNLTVREVEAALKRAGEGKRAIIYAHRGDPEVGHYFNAANHGGVIIHLDGQAGGTVDPSGFVDGEFSMLWTNQ